jgi:maleylpyruvate isomerase
MTTARTFADGRRWTAEGTELLLEGVAGLDEAGFAAPSLLPDWTRGQLIAHVAANADAVGNLVRWASTGVETPMYGSPQERAEGIAKGLTLSAAELDAWLRDSAAHLAEAMDALTEEQWRHEVVTVQGRTVPATEAPWMRSRELCVHAVDLGTGLTFADLPAGFNAALRAEILDKRGMSAVPEALAAAPEPEVTAWLAGRPHTLTDAPVLGPWL